MVYFVEKLRGAQRVIVIGLSGFPRLFNGGR